MRPLTPVYTHIEEILGVEIHNALCGLTSHENALSSAHERIQAVLDSVLSQP